MMAFGIVGKRYGDAGLRDALIHGQVIAEGSVDSVLSGKMYSRAIRANKIMNEALKRKLLDKF